MHKTVYIEKDEEITSIVSKIKKELGRDIFLVVPKGALLAQGMINLKLLKKEADRLEKELFIITGDEKVKKIIAKVGLKIGDINDNQETAKNPKLEAFSEVASNEALNILESSANTVREIGSASFFEKKEVGKEKNSFIQDKHSSAEELNSEELRGMLYGRKKRAADSVHLQNQSSDFSNKKKEKGNFFDFSNKRSAVVPQGKANDFFDNQMTNERHLKVRKDNSDGPVFPARNKSFQAENFAKAEEFFSENSLQNQLDRKPKLSLRQKENMFPRKELPSIEKKTGKAKWVLSFLFLLFLISFSGWAYWNWPKVNIKLYPRASKIEGNIELKVLSEGDYVLGNGEIQGNYHEFTVEKTVEMETSGMGTGSKEGKAIGKVTILNKYSQTSQSLVATTRLLSKEGKLFRLSKDVVVPGMKGDDPGKVEANVIADKAGDDYNIGPTTFTIEGFKGSAKYEKFEVSSVQTMEGGGIAGKQSEEKIVLQKDIDVARIKAMDEIGRDLNSLVEEKIGTGQKYFIESAGKEVTEAFADRKLNEVADKFNYTVKEKIKLISFDEKMVRSLINDKIMQDAGEGSFPDKDKIFITYDKPIIDWEKKTMEVMINYDGIVLTQLENATIKKDVVGKNEEEIKSLLVGYKQIERAELEYYPSWAGRWPVLERNLTVTEAERK